MLKSARNARSCRGDAAGGSRGLLRPVPVAHAACLRIAGRLRLSPLALVVAAPIVGAGAGLGAVAFRWLIYSVTWLATGHEQFGQQGRAGSLHFPWLGIGFLVLIPVAGGLLYGPLIYRHARAARGHGVPEVMIAGRRAGREDPPAGQRR